MPSQIIAAAILLLVVVLAAGLLSIFMGMHWLGLAIVILASVAYGVFLGKSRHTGTTE